MRLYLIRHAIAEEAHAGLSDAARALTPEGRERMLLELHGMRRLGFGFERLLHSPLRRARETAELVAPLVAGELEVCDLLAAPPGPALRACLAGESIALVGHEPWLTQLAGELLGEAYGAPLKKGGVLVLEGEPRPGGMQLVQALAPAELRALGAT